MLLLSGLMVITGGGLAESKEEEIREENGDIIVEEGDSIQDAINKSSEGDTIRVWEGTYDENITVNRSITLIGNGTAETTIDGDGNTVIKITADQVNVTGFTVENSGSMNSGIKLDGVQNCKIWKNNVTSTFFGIHLSHSDSNNITNNNVEEQMYSGYGMFLDFSDNNIIHGNNLSNNYRGLYVDYSNHNDIRYNTLYSNDDVGIELFDGSSSNEIVNNNFLENEVQARVDESYNTWDLEYPIGGNHWSDHTEPDINEDGFVDEPYEDIEGEGSDWNKDSLPYTEKDGWEAPPPDRNVLNTYQDLWYENISDAVETAGSHNTLKVSPGTYNESVFINTDHLTIIGEEGPENTIIDGGGDGNTVSISSNHVEISGFKISGGGTLSRGGIRIWGSSHCTIENIDFTNNAGNGISLSGESTDNTITNCNIYNNNRDGIYLQDDSVHNIITNCNIHNNRWGIYLTGSSHYNTITDNNVSNNDWGGMVFDSVDSSEISNNKVWNNSDSGISSSGNNVIIMNNTANFNNNMGIRPSGDNITIMNNTANFNKEDGIHSSGTDITIMDNTANSNNGHGILSTGEDNTIIDNIISKNNETGIRLEDSYYSTISENIVSNNENGINLQYSNNNLIKNNSITDNTDYGIYFRGYNTHNNTITENLISNSDNGIYLWGFDVVDNTIKRNTISDNEHGVYVQWSSNNAIYHNDFIDNTVQAYHEDDRGENRWDNGYPNGGNYWSDYDGVDEYHGESQDKSGPDGIGDIPYEISGEGEDRDNYPLMRQFTEGGMIQVSPYWRSDSPVIFRAQYDNSEYVELWYAYSDDNETYGDYTKYANDTESSNIWSWDFYFEEEVGWYRFYSIAGNTTSGYREEPPEEAEVELAFETTPPTSHSSKTGPYWINTEPLELNAEADDDLSGVDEVELWYRYSTDNETWNDWTLFESDTRSPWSCDFDFPDGDGYYEFYSIAIDRAGNQETAPSSADTRCAYDSTPPSVVDNSPDSGTTADEYTFSATITDNMALSEYRVIYWFGDGTETNVTMTNSDADDYEYEITIPSDSVDLLYYRISAADLAGNWNSTEAASVTIIDNIPPVADAGPNQNVEEGTTVTFDGSQSSDNIGIVNYTWSFSYDHDEVLLYGAEPSFEFNIIGSYTVTLTVRDEAENTDTDTMEINVTEEKVGFMPDNLVLNVDPLSGEAPLSVEIHVSADNYEGDEGGILEVFIDDVAEYTLNLTAHGYRSQSYWHEFQEEGSYTISFGEHSETVSVEESDDPTDDNGEPEDDEEDDDDGEEEEKTEEPGIGFISDYWWIIPLIIIIGIVGLVVMMKLGGNEPSIDEEDEEMEEEAEQSFQEEPVEDESFEEFEEIDEEEQ